MKQESVIKALGYKLSATVLSIAGATGKKLAEKFLVSLPNRGQTTWKGQKEQRGQPAFDLAYLPGLFLDALRLIMAQGFDIAPDGVISGSVRPYDLVIANTNGVPLMPALSSECNAATEEVEYLRDQGVEEVIGRLEPQMALPKLLWALKQHPALKEKIGTVMTTGDFIAMQLTGVPTTSSSDAVSNGLIEQTSRKFADDFICSIHGLKYFWFPPVVQSGSLIPWEKTSEYRSTDWCGVRSLLPGWRFIAGLGNYQAGAVGSGLDGLNTIIISAGTSGTVTRAVKFGTKIAGTPRQFEYFDYTLLLSIMADCASWYDRFVKEFGQGKSHAALDGMIAPYGNVLCLPYPETPDAEFPGWFYQMPLDTQVKTMQHSIAIRLVRHFREIVGALPASEAEHAIERVVLTGGLTRSQYFCKVLRDQLRFEDGFEGKIFVSSRTGPLANQAATLGALINALVGAQTYPTLAVAIKALCPTREI